MQKPSCEYCGRCLSVCPSYQHHLVETMSPRARVDLCAGVEDGSLVAGPRFGESLSGCLQCLACTDICGKGVDGAAIVLEARLKQGMGRPSLARCVEKVAVTWLLPRRKWLVRVVRVLGRLQKFLPLESRGTVRHVPDILMGGIGQRSLPPLSRHSLFAQLPARIDPPQGVACAGDVALFTGCFGGVVNTDAARALVHRLHRHGYRVHVPAAQSCCAAPAMLSGFAQAFAKAQVHNAKVFAALGDMPVLTLCATCHRTLTHAYGDAPQKPEDAVLVRDVAARIVDAAVFVAQLGNAEHGAEGSARAKIRVAVHDPCHMRLNPESGTAARACLAAMPHVEVVELPVRGQCCGGGGVSSLKNPELADKLGQQRAQMIIDAGVDVVVAQCPGCVLQLNNHLSRLDSRSTAARAKHLMEFL